MPARKNLLPVTTGVRRTDFKVKNWGRIDRIYAVKLPDSLKDRIEQITGNYVALGTMELRAQPLSESIETIAGLTDLTRKLRSRLSNALSLGEKPKDVQFFLIHHLHQNLRLPNAPPLGDHIRPLLMGLESLQETLEGAEQSLKKSSDPQMRGQEWGRWIGAISKAIEQSGLRAKGRGKSVSANNDVKTGTTSGGMSAFVRLIKELQTQLPCELVHGATDAALSKAINRVIAPK